jgi:hypothetical protein
MAILGFFDSFMVISGALCWIPAIEFAMLFSGMVSRNISISGCNMTFPTHEA